METQKSKSPRGAAIEVDSDYDHIRWLEQLPSTLEKHGFLVKVADRLREPEWHRTTMTHLVCGVMDEVSRVKLDKVGPAGAGEELRAIVNAALEENLKGSYASALFQVVVAQKPE